MGSTEPIKEQPKVVAGFQAILSVHAERLRAMQPERPVTMTMMTMVSLYSFFTHNALCPCPLTHPTDTASMNAEMLLINGF